MSAQKIYSGEGDVLPGINLSQTVVPAIPRNFLSRKELFSLIGPHGKGVTLVIAPAGYGKTSLIAEWAKSNSSKTIWATAGGDEEISFFKNVVFQAVRNVFPDFAPWYQSTSQGDPREDFRKFFKDIENLQEEITFVLDNGQVNSGDSNPLAQFMLDLIPDNLHLIVIRRTAPLISYSRFAQAGDLNLITAADLKFSNHEISVIAEQKKLDIQDPEVKAILDLAGGWPVAIQMLAKNLAKGARQTNFALRVSSDQDPLHLLVKETFEFLSSDEQGQLIALATLKEFDLDTAQLILGKGYSQQFLNKLVAEGIYLSTAGESTSKYEFHPIMREVINQIAASRKIDRTDLHKSLVDHFLQRDDMSAALDQAYMTNDYVRMNELLRAFAREMVATGQGEQLLRWARFAGDESPQGLLMRETVEIMGHLTNLDYRLAEAKSQSLMLRAKESEIGDFLKRIAHSAMLYVEFARGNLLQMDEIFTEMLANPVQTGDLENSDKIAVLRLLADKAFICEDSDALKKYFESAQEFATSGLAIGVPFTLNAMEAMSLYTEGHYYQAFELAQLALAQAHERNFRGVSAPYEVHLVLARCYEEFSRLDEAIEHLEILKEMAEKAGQWPWYLTADSGLIKISLTKGDFPQARESLRLQRELFASEGISRAISWLVDISEIDFRCASKDFDRADSLLKRLPQNPRVEQLRDDYFRGTGKQSLESNIFQTSEKNPREKIRKYLRLANSVADREKECSQYLRQALSIGADSGAQEIFVRQSDSITSKILKIASEQPTLYLDGLARAITAKIKGNFEGQGNLTEALTTRELEIVKHLSTSKPINTIAESLHISHNTIKTHLRNVYRKLEVGDRDAAVERAKDLLLV